MTLGTRLNLLYNYKIFTFLINGKYLYDRKKYYKNK